MADGTPDALASRVLRPRRDGLARVLAALTGVAARHFEGPPYDDDSGLRMEVWRDGVDWLRGRARIQDRVLWSVTDPAEAWLALEAHGLLPPGTVDAPGRAFEAVRRVGSLERTAVALPQPPDVAACVALAADWAGILGAEAIACEVVTRVYGRTPSRVIWRVMDHDAAVRHLGRDDIDGVGPVVGAQRDLVRWRVLPGSGRPLPPYYRMATDLLATGYGLDAVTDDAVVLVAPGV